MRIRFTTIDDSSHSVSGISAICLNGQRVLAGHGVFIRYNEAGISCLKSGARG